MIEEILLEIEKRYSILCSNCSTSTRNRHGKIIRCLLEEYPETKNYWAYLPNEYFWCNRFRLIEIENYPKQKKLPTYVDPLTNLNNAPNISGLYFFGQTVFNPHTHEEHYWVKIGLSGDMPTRMKSYKTDCPMLFVIGYKEINENLDDEEALCQSLIKQVALFDNQNNDEWFKVDKEIYLEMCEKKFDYFSQTS